MKAIVVLVTVPDAKTSRKFADKLVGEKLAACVTEVPGVRSTYRWKGKVERAQEIVLMIKTRKSLVKKLERRIRALHPYQVPEILAMTVGSGEERYLRWIGESTKR